MKSRLAMGLVATGVIALLGTFGRLATADNEVKCPVSGAAAKTGEGAVWTHVNGQAVYFCCENCPKAFAADPEKYAAKMTMKCPVMKNNGAKAEKNLRLAVNNGYVYSCCAGCPQAFLKSPEKYLAELPDPITGKPFKLSSNTPHVTYKNAHFYFASEESKKMFEASPEKYARVLGS
jgi:YHS domain-containing protein